MDTDTVHMAHGSGGSLMRRLIDEVFVDTLKDAAALNTAEDAAILPASPDQLAISTDTYVVSPLFFPGGDIGRLAVCGTVNDVATTGARPLYLSAGFILEEGLPIAHLRRVLVSMREAASEAGVLVVTGDTKVVERGHGDGVYINTTGIGRIPAGVSLSASACRPGDAVLLSGTLGDHGITVVSVREGLEFSTSVRSDAAPLNQLTAAVLEAAPGTRCFRDPTRGGLASALNEIATASAVTITIDEQVVPAHPHVTAVCEILGYDIFHVANEGKMIAIVPAEQADAALAAMRGTPYGSDAALIGEVGSASERGLVYVRTAIGSRRVMDMLVGEQLPRIC